MATSAMLKKMIGKTSETIGFEIERGQIRRFAKAIGESILFIMMSKQPLRQDTTTS